MLTGLELQGQDWAGRRGERAINLNYEYKKRSKKVTVHAAVIVMLINLFLVDFLVNMRC